MSRLCQRLSPRLGRGENGGRGGDRWAVPIPALLPLTDRPILTWLDDAFTALSSRMQLPAGPLYDAAAELARQGHPVRPDALRAKLAALEQAEADTDSVWSPVVTLTRLSGHDGQAWRLIACGLAVDTLRQLARRFRTTTSLEVHDIHADLLEGFLAFLTRINLARPHVAPDWPMPPAATHGRNAPPASGTPPTTTSPSCDPATVDPECRHKASARPCGRWPTTSPGPGGR